MLRPFLIGDAKFEFWVFRLWNSYAARLVGDAEEKKWVSRSSFLQEIPVSRIRVTWCHQFESKLNTVSWFPTPSVWGVRKLSFHHCYLTLSCKGLNPHMWGFDEIQFLLVISTSFEIQNYLSGHLRDVSQPCSPWRNSIFSGVNILNQHCIIICLICPFN